MKIRKDWPVLASVTAPTTWPGPVPDLLYFSGVFVFFGIFCLVCGILGHLTLAYVSCMCPGPQVRLILDSNVTRPQNAIFLVLCAI